MLDLPDLSLKTTPIVHTIHPGFLPSDIYEEMRRTFPVCPPSGGPTGFSYFRGDPLYDALVSGNQAWRAFVDGILSEEFVDYCLDQFGDAFRELGCLVDISKARYTDFFETRAQKAKRHIDPDGRAPEDLWVRADILQGRTGYWREAHLDHRRRLLTMLIYFSDVKDDAMEGGSLVLHEAAEHASPGDLEIPPRHNLMAAFPCAPNSWHSVTPITKTKRTRDFIQITLSSPIDAWPAA